MPDDLKTEKDVQENDNQKNETEPSHEEHTFEERMERPEPWPDHPVPNNHDELSTNTPISDNRRAVCNL